MCVFSCGRTCACDVEGCGNVVVATLASVSVSVCECCGIYRFASSKICLGINAWETVFCKSMGSMLLFFPLYLAAVKATCIVCILWLLGMRELF